MKATTISHLMLGLILLGSISSCVKEKGCTNPTAENYNANAEENDGSCVINGCTDPTADNYNPEATVDDGSCSNQGPSLIFKFQFDPNQERYDSFGQPATVPNGNAAQSPSFNSISGHYVEMIPSAWTALGAGEVVYQGPETDAGGDMAIDFDQAEVVGEDEVFLSIPLSSVATGTYEFVRVSVSYQNYDITYNALGFNGLTGTLASFVGYNTYITSYNVGQMPDEVNDDKLQGYWAFESAGTLTTGQAPAGATTVPNPIFASSPIPQGSCLVTGEFEVPLTVTGNETEDVTVVLSVSTNQSFEWTDSDGNGEYDPLDGDIPVDMGLRGLKAIVQ